MKDVMEASHAVSEAVKAIEPDVIAAYPITPQTHIVERISEFVANGEIKSEYIRVESEFSAISACLGASAAGTRAYTSTSSQGLALMHEVLFIVSGMRLPVCMSVVNRALSAPINIWNDHQDSISERDTGWIQLYVETAQEAYDMTIMQHRISEDPRVLLPSMVCMDGFTLSHVYEAADIHDKKDVDSFLPKYKPVHAVLDPKEPLTQGPIGFPSHYMEFRSELCKAIDGSLDVIEEVMKDYSKKFPCTIENSRPKEYYHVEEHRMEDADVVLVAMGSVCGTIKVVIDELREKGVKAGLLKLITYRPFPAELLKEKLKGAGKVAVVEKALSPGLGGPLYHEISSALYECEERPELRNFIVGLGGKDVRLDHVEKIIDMTMKGEGKREEWMF
ncbi:MAG: pyruvate ferredoxin oxidoreductase [Candidatus Altiarchaeales archaeon]|nr:pyruvate ferredoxin oxidoreductase [Candidatus Altiarchaeales archaeon]MBD3416693.1 pyruvate ferredoxin oxidoreductase [Candidatus Altiarchaeales archaeon]